MKTYTLNLPNLSSVVELSDSISYLEEVMPNASKQLLQPNHESKQYEVDKMLEVIAYRIFEKYFIDIQPEGFEPMRFTHNLQNYLDDKCIKAKHIAKIIESDYSEFQCNENLLTVLFDKGLLIEQNYINFTNEETNLIAIAIKTITPTADEVRIIAKIIEKLRHV